MTTSTHRVLAAFVLSFWFVIATGCGGVPEPPPLDDQAMQEIEREQTEVEQGESDL